MVFSDYPCPFCAKWSRDSLPGMMEYVEAGAARIEWRDINTYGDLTQEQIGDVAAARKPRSHTPARAHLPRVGDERGRAGCSLQAELRDDVVCGRSRAVLRGGDVS